jgi:hypothetical protein
VTIDWGDGSDTETVTANSDVNTSHTYASIGDYVITLAAKEGCTFALGQRQSTNGGVIGKPTLSTSRPYRNAIRRVEIGAAVTQIYGQTFYHFYSLESVTIPNNVTIIEYNAFGYCYSLSSMVIPNSLRNIDRETFRYCTSLKRILIPNGLVTIGDSAFCYCYSLVRVVFPSTIAGLGSMAFGTCSKAEEYDFSRAASIPTLSSYTAFSGIEDACIIKVPSTLYDTWKEDTNWSQFASNIVGV